MVPHSTGAVLLLGRGTFGLRDHERVILLLSPDWSSLPASHVHARVVTWFLRGSSLLLGGRPPVPTIRWALAVIVIVWGVARTPRLPCRARLRRGGETRRSPIACHVVRLFLVLSWERLPRGNPVGVIIRGLDPDWQRVVGFEGVFIVVRLGR